MATVHELETLTTLISVMERLEQLESRLKALERIVQEIPASLSQWRDSQRDFTNLLERLEADQDRADFWREGERDDE